MLPEPAADLRLGVLDELSGPWRHLRGEAAARIHRVLLREVELLAELVVILAVHDGGVDDARAILGRDESASTTM